MRGKLASLIGPRRSLSAKRLGQQWQEREEDLLGNLRKLAPFIERVLAQELEPEWELEASPTQLNGNSLGLLPLSRKSQMILLASELALIRQWS